MANCLAPIWHTALRAKKRSALSEPHGNGHKDCKFLGGRAQVITNIWQKKIPSQPIRSAAKNPSESRVLQFSVAVRLWTRPSKRWTPIQLLQYKFKSNLAIVCQSIHVPDVGRVFRMLKISTFYQRQLLYLRYMPGPWMISSFQRDRFDGHFNFTCRLPPGRGPPHATQC